MKSPPTIATNRKWLRTTLERYGKVEPIPDAWSLVGPDGTLFVLEWTPVLSNAADVADVVLVHKYIIKQ